MMVGKAKVGRWGLLGRSELGAAREGYLTFEQEVARATARAVKTKSDSQGQMNLFPQEPLPGWSAPLFAFVGVYLCIRRPEGIWKFLCPAAEDQPAQLYLPSSCGGKLEAVDVGSPKQASNAWHRLPGEAASPEQMDLWRRPPAGTNAHEFGGHLSRTVEEAGHVIFLAGDGFCSPPTLAHDGGRWIYGEDGAGRRLVFDVADYPWTRQAALDGDLYFRFTSDFFEPFDAQVELARG